MFKVAINQVTLDPLNFNIQHHKSHEIIFCTGTNLATATATTLNIRCLNYLFKNTIVTGENSRFEEKHFNYIHSDQNQILPDIKMFFQF